MAAPGTTVHELCEEATCSICLDYFMDPLMVAECGHNFCRACLSQYSGESDVQASCPQCRGTFQKRNLRPNRQLANFVEIARKLIGQGGQVCEKHQEPLKLFCRDHEAPICVVCDRAKEHKDHQVVPLEEDQILSRLDMLRKEREKILAYKADTEKENQDLLKLTEKERQRTVDLFRQLHQFLAIQEELLLAQMDEVKQGIAKKREEHMAVLTWEISSLESLIQELEEKCQQPAGELVQVRRGRGVMLLVDPACRLFPLFTRFSTANVTLDPITAHPQLILSKDCKSISWGVSCQDLPKNPERFDVRPFVLGREGFAAGRHFWEVTVGREGIWAVGVARKSVRRKGPVEFAPDEGIWAVGRWNGQYRSIDPPLDPLLPLSGDLRRIRVNLNCAESQVCFFNADTGDHLYTFPVGSSFGEALKEGYTPSKIVIKRIKPD
uniref:Zinc finger protein RFP-like n=1 Tax=Varanus komodoensis TaxID=61221 RepID=A0A8D2JDK8_VARKO